jgi:hypothetical protein
VLVNEGPEQDLIRGWFAANFRAGPVVKIGGIWIGLWEAGGPGQSSRKPKVESRKLTCGRLSAFDFRSFWWMNCS